MLPLLKFRTMLENYKQQMTEDFNELIGAAEVIGRNPNYLTVDEHGYYHVQASGKSHEVIAALELQLAKMKRIQSQKDHQ